MDDWIIDAVFEEELELVLVIHLFNQRKLLRLMKWQHRRLDWDEYDAMLLHTNEFENTLHMSYEAFSILVDLIRPGISIDPMLSSAGSGGNDPIYPEMVASIGLRWFGGELEKSLKHIHGVSRDTVCRMINLFLKAVKECEHLAIQLPTTEEGLKELADGFGEVSESQDLMYGCVGAIDGWLCTHERPRFEENQADYFSGHYHRYGSNVQAVCDSKLKFIYVAYAAPGKTNNINAFRMCTGLHEWMHALTQERKYYLVGDNAYQLSDQLLIPFSGANISRQNSDFNFFLSQMRIRIEMAFGRLTTKWRIFRRDFQYDVTKIRDTVMVACQLHNFVIAHGDSIEQNKNTEDFIEALEQARDGLGYYETTQETSAVEVGHSARREWLSQQIQLEGIGRPTANTLFINH